MKQIIYFFCILPVFINAQTITDVQRLYKDLLSNYTKEVMPTPCTETLDIQIGIFIISINYFREVEESLSLTGSFILRWHDPRLKWNPSSYSNMSMLIIDPINIWLPPLVIINRVDKFESIGDGKKFYLTVDSSGFVGHSPGDVLDVKCITDISKFPFDRQTCTLRLIPYGIQMPYILLKHLFKDEQCQFDYYTPNSDWTLEKCTQIIDNSIDHSNLYVIVQIKRQPLYYTIMVVFPTFLFGFLNPLVFIVPVETGERIGLAITLLLSYAIFLTLASASVPATSNPMCALLIVMVIIITVSGIILYGTTITIKYHYKKKTDYIWSPLKGLVRWTSNCQCCCVKTAESAVNVPVTKDEVVYALDSLFFYGSYVLMILIGFGYFLYVLI
ncbi:acetylcholine receptor subunit beta-type lev-1-like [Mytilus trossulus]|uniref:acetylcholine receptor subunit beta-type lev-1-like n=1 Tax=Mytilus trossulus TaxID=6551 RepID=UPI003004FAC3